MNDLIRRRDAVEFAKYTHIASLNEEERVAWIMNIPTIEPSEYADIAYGIGVCQGKASVEAKLGEWIPCSERLPEENEEVLVCDKDGTMEVCDLEMFGRGIGLKWTDKNGYECWLDVVAWMPLPEPYGEREGE